MKTEVVASPLNYGWVVVAALSLTETVSYGILYYSFTVFIEPMQAAFGWSKIEITGAFSLSLLISGFAAVFMGRWIDRVGVRGLMTVGSVLATLLMLAWASVETLPAFYLIWMGMGIASAAVLYESAFALVVHWFTTKRSQALTVLTFIAGFASVIFIPLAGWLVENVGWRSALVVLAIIIGVLTIPTHLFLLRDQPERAAKSLTPVSHAIAVTDIFRRRDFWWLTLAFTLSVFVINGLGVHLVPYLIREGYAPAIAAGMAGAIGTVALPGRIIFTPLGARLSRHTLTALLFVCQGIGLVILILSQNPVGVWLFVFLYGVGFGAISPARASLIAETYGAAFYGTISGRMTLIGAGARALSPLSISLLFSWFNDYNAALGLLAGAALVAGFAVWQARHTR